ncbi:hypothetical protein RJ639_036907 [Escallonia herrerae]|uniref:Retrotransposon gag domain-containing protein n=1 Tax=Escallonia herrerae TaxID=1293975 RepID=A0AA88WR19_9ASTE|nr:hypothetical protein RJ639_036907 [Escallonia herrerae]
MWSGWDESYGYSTVKDLSSATGDVEARIRSKLEAFGERLQQTVASQVELIFNRLDDLEVDSRLTVLERKVDVFAKELDDLIKEKVSHFTKWEVQQNKDLKGQVMELQEELSACKKDLTRVMRQGCIAVLPRGKKMPEPRSYDGMREASQVDNLFWHLERYFEALDIDDEKEKVQMVVMYLNDTVALRWRRRYIDGCDVKTWEKFKHELKRQFYPESVVDIAMINLRWLRQKGSIYEYLKEYSALMLKISEMSERQKLCFFIDGLHKLRRREPHDLASAMAIIERLEDFKQCERPRSPRHERAKDGGDGRSKSGSPKVADDERSGDEGRHRHHKEEKKQEGSRKHGPHYERYCLHKEVIKNVDLRIGGWTGKKNFNIIDMDELGVVLGMDFMKKSSTALNPYCGVMMMMIVGKEGQPEWMIPLLSKDGANARKGITVLQLEEGLKLCYIEWEMGPRTYTVDMLTKMITTDNILLQ